jgi:hypothetical protein
MREVGKMVRCMVQATTNGLMREIKLSQSIKGNTNMELRKGMEITRITRAQFSERCG